jgi:hypothetical protein
MLKYNNKTHIIFLCKNQKERDHYENIDIGGRIILKWILEKYGRVIWGVLIWFRMGTSGGLL